MARISKHIYYDIDESDIKLEYNNLVFYFSSDFNLNRYKNKIIDFIKLENYKLEAKYNIKVDFSEMLLISYYMKIEKRGFRVYKKEIDLKNNKICFVKFDKNDIIKSKVGD